MAYAKKSRDDQKAEAAEALERLHGQVAEINGSEEWLDYLATMSKFRSYSPLNTMLMWMQWEGRRRENPELPELSQPAAFSKWKGMGRWIRKGEKGLGVLVPIRVTDRDAEPGDDGRQPKKLVGFRLVFKTFDVAQTDGEPLPENPIREEMVEGEGDEAVWAALVDQAEALGYRVEIADEVLPAHGDCNFLLKRLRVAESLPAAQQVKTLVHELAHATLHSPDEYLLAHSTPYHVAEVEAESVAFTVMALLGRDTSSYSVGYVASWSKGDGELIAKTAEKVIGTAQRIAEAVEASVEVQQEAASAA
ncbi:MAG TPA: ArdC-like ssDNA-binding domain-containing protein [Acidimicrobiales bacterium]|nr:ArdC-like ssDNA-binding domain-containing protein [Acidimicrobiales bacterium]